MAKQLNVNLAFKAETGQAKQAIMDLQSALSKVASMNINTPGLDANKLKAASSAAKELSIHLNNAFNAETGNFDLSKLDRSLKTSSTNVTELSSKLLGAGASGEQAFVKLAQSIAAADRPVVTLNSKLNEMLTTLKNTARWQISSSILHGFMGAVQQAYGYAQDLNESLTNIRIVTGQNIEQMSKFAVEANKAAKTLSTTTTEYTNASLIYYQQGLSDAEVAKRTEVTIKMANAAGQSAQIVSDQLTAVWNNFYDGSKSLEYYADVMTALGAATASSTDEIAGGLEKFAAIGETIGLSYEYAASALATITSNTRQSEEVVGTALKTIFARIQGLNLGETLDDGTTLNKYSKALQSVGISIFDQAGELKDMDNILNEMADKWDALSKAQQVALAQTVAGTRQYTQLVALMDNWDNGDNDSMTANLDTAYNSTGTLQDQADIYAESWEAARDRVRASLETIYNQLLDDDFFIDISNGFAGLLDSVSAFIDGIGGIKTILIAIGSIFLSSVANKIQPALMNLKHSFSVVFQSAEKQAQSLAGEMNKGIQDTLDSSVGKNFSDASKTALQNAMTMNSAKAKLQGVESNLNDLEKQRFNLELQMLQADQDAAQAVADKITKRKEEIALLKEAFDYESSTKTLENSRGKEEEDLIDSKRAAEQAYLADPTNANKTALTEATNQLNEHRAATERLINAREQYAKSLYDAYNAEMQTTQGAIESSTKLYSVQQMMPDVVEHYTKALSGMQAQPLEKQREIFARLKGEIEQIVGDSCPDLQKAMDMAFKSRSPEAFKKNISGVMQALKDAKIPAKDLEKILSSMGQGKNVKQIREQYKALGKETSDLAERQRKLNAALEEFNPKHTVTGIERVTQAAAGLGQVAMLAQSVRSIFQAWGNDDLSFGEKLMTTFTGLSMIIPSAIGAFKSLNVAMNGSLTTAIAAAAASRAYNVTIDQQISKHGQELIIKRLINGESLDAIANGIAESAVKKGLIKEEEKENYILALKTKFKTADIASSIKNTVTKIAEALGIKTKSAADKTETAGIWAKVAAKIAELAASWPLLAVTLLIVAAIAALAAVVALVVTGIQAMVAAYNADAIAAENAATAAKNLGEAYSEVKSEYEDMISAMENYQSARDALDELTKGTEEYREALKEANRQALELISQYGLIEGQDYEWQGDELVIKDSAMSRVKSEKEAEVDQAYAASQMANAEAKRTQAIADQTALRREMRDDAGVGNGDQWWKGALDVLAGVSMDVLSGGITGGMGTMAAVASVSNRAAKADAYDAAIDKAIEEGMTNANLWTDKVTMAQELNLNDQDLIDALWANKDSIQQLSADMNAAAQAEKLAAQNAANEIMDSKGYDNTEAGRMAMEAGGEIYQQMYGEAYDKYLADAKDRGLFNTGTDASKAAFEEYAKQAGLDQLKNFEVTNYKGDGTVEYKYIDEQGQEQTALATAEEIAATLAAAEAANNLEGALSALRVKIDELNNSQNEADHALAEFISKGNLEGATKEEYDAIKEEIGDVTSDADIEAYLDKKFGDGKDGQISDETAQKYGYENADAMVAAMKASLEIEWEVPEGLQDEIADKLTLGAAAKIQSTYEKMGEQGGQAFINTLETVASGADWEALSPEKQTQMMEEMANIDWSSWDAGERAIEIAEKYGIAIDGTTQEWQKQINAMRDATNALPDLQAMREEYAKIQEITADIDLGSILSEEDYETLVKYNSELEKYFAILSDGSAQFIGDKLDFQQEIEAQHTQELLEAMQIYKDRNAEIEAQIAAGEKAVGGEGKLDQYRDTENYVGDDGNNYYSGSNVNKQLDFLESQGYDSDQLAEWRKDLADGGTTVNVLEDIANAVDSTADSFNNLGTEASENEALIQGMMNELALSAESAAERAELLESGLIDADAYGYAAMAAHNEEKWEGMDPDEVEDYADSLMNAADASDLLSDELKDNEEAAEDVALYTKKMNKGIEALSEGFEDWSDVLTKSDKASEEYSEAMNGMKSAMSDVLGVSEDFLSDDFILQNMEDIKLAAEGDAAAIDRLAIAAAQDILINVGFEDEGVKAEVMALHNELAGMIPDIQVGATLDDGDFLSKAAQVVETANMTVEEANAYFRALGFEPHFETKEVKTTVRKPKVRTHTDYAASVANVSVGGLNIPVPTFDAIQTSWNEGYTEVDETIEVPSLTTDGGEPNFTLTRTNSGAMNNSSGSNSGGNKPSGGGGGSKPSTAEKRDTTNKSDVVERYRELNDAIDNVTDALTRAERATDRLWGKDKIAAMKEENKILQQQRDLILEKAEEAEKYAREDAQNLRDVADEVGVSLVIDQETGDITNIEDAQNTLYERLETVESTYNQMVEDYNKKVEAAIATYGEENIPESIAESLETDQKALEAYEEDVVGKAEENIEKFNEAEEKFQGSIEEWENAGLEAEEILDQIMQNNYDIIMEGLEIPLSLNEEDLRLIELKLSQVEDDIYNIAEAVELTQSQLGEYRDNLQLADEALAELNRAHEVGEITDAAYQEGLGEIRDKYYENVEALMELDNTMMEYYSNTIDMANEELSKYSDQIEHQTSVLDHYNSLIGLMGKSNDYKMIGKVLEGQVKTTKDAMTVSKQWYETQRANADSLAAEYVAAQARGASDEELELIKANWDAAEASANEAQDKMLSDAEAWAEALRAVLENKLADLGQTLENALTGGTSFDTINTQMERAQSLQEEYLTTTNQIYETNKLMRTAQQEIDKTTNSVAKKKLQAYIAETEQLQNQSKLSQYELDIQKAKYDLLLAEIALEEAQDAKSTVRLQRDSEGNFGYVYTADQNKLAEAQQQLEDAQNSLYNIGLEGANDYAQKYQQTMQEMYDTFADLQQQKLDGAFETEEEYHRAMEEAKAYYYQKLQDYSGLYSVAVTTDSRVVADAWSSDFADMVYDTDEWMSAVDQYVTDVELAFKEWSDAVHDPSTGITAIVGGDVAAVGETVQGVTDKSAELAKTTTEKVIPALDDELDAVQNMTGAYAAMRQEIQAVIEEYTNMINRINNSQTNEWNNGNSGDGNTGGGDGDDSGSGGDTSGGDRDGSEGDTGSEGEGSGEGAGGDETKTDSYRYGTVEFRGNGADRIWIDEAGKQYAYNSSQGKALQTAFNKAFGRNGGYKGDYWIGWTDTGGKLKADILREKDGLRTGGYTGEWAGSYGKLALLHQKELVLNAQDTENLLTSMEVLNKIVEMIDLQSMSSQLGGMLNSPSLGLHSGEVLEQNVHIEASFPGVQDRNEIEEAFNNLINKASQFANRK